MKIEKLDHVNLRTANLDMMVVWYSTILGLTAGKRPNFAFPGAWLYAGDQPVVHLVGVDGNPGAGSEGALKLEHFALSATGRAEFESRLTTAGEKFERSELSDFGIIQLNVWDPDGNHLHIDFASQE